MGRIRNAIGRFFTPATPPGSTQRDYVRGVRRRAVSGDPRLLGSPADMDSYNDVVASILTSLTGDLVGGNGIRPSFDTPDPALNERLARLWERWSEADSEVTGLAFDEAMTIIIRGWILKGEAFVVKTETGRIQILDSDDIDDLNNQGIECDSLGRPTLYRFRMGTGTVQVPAEYVMHVAHRTRPHQVRGISPMLPALDKINLLSEYDINEGRAAANAARFAVVVTTTDGNQVVDREDDGDLADIGAGLVVDKLQVGEDVKVIQNHRPSSELSAYRDAVNRAIFSSIGADTIAGTRRADGSFSSSRALANAASRDADLKHLLLKRQLYQPLVKWLVEDVWARSGLIALTEATRWAATHPDWLRNRMDWIDPLRMSQAMQILLKSGLASREELRHHFSGFGQTGPNPPTPASPAGDS